MAEESEKTWELYEILLGGRPGASGEAADAADSQATYVDGLKNDPAYQPDSTVNGVVQPMVIDQKSSNSADAKALPGGRLLIGDMVHAYNEEWIVVDSFTDKMGITCGTLWLCNNKIRFQNHSSKIYEYYCVVDDGSYSARNASEQIHLLSNTYRIYITLDTNTKQIFVDKRLAFDNIYNRYGEQILEVYEVSGIDVKSHNFGKGSHLMVMLVQRDTYNPETDSIELNLCDKYVGSNETNTPTETGSCVINGKDYIKIGSTKNYQAMFIDSNGDTVTDISAVWSITKPDDITTIIANNTVAVNIPLKDDLIGSTIIMNITESSGDYGSFTKEIGVIANG